MLEVRVQERGWASINPDHIVGVIEDYGGATTCTLMTLSSSVPSVEMGIAVFGQRVAVAAALQFAKQAQRPVLVEGVDADGANPGAATVAAWRALDLRIAVATGYAQGAYYPTYPEALAACEAAEAAAIEAAKVDNRSPSAIVQDMMLARDKRLRDEGNAGKGDEQEQPKMGGAAPFRMPTDRSRPTIELVEADRPE